MNFLFTRYTEAVELHKKLRTQKGPNDISIRDKFINGISSSLSSINKFMSNEDSFMKTLSAPKGKFYLNLSNFQKVLQLKKNSTYL